ncbi:MAG: hypothetical protein IIB12_09515, partial [Chloroflexi bacterium]|nr:hypothetical protein [Chloroflexota bacterium]
MNASGLVAQEGQGLFEASLKLESGKHGTQIGVAGRHEKVLKLIFDQRPHEFFPDRDGSAIGYDVQWKLVGGEQDSSKVAKQQPMNFVHVQKTPFTTTK